MTAQLIQHVQNLPSLSERSAIQNHRAKGRYAALMDGIGLGSSIGQRILENLAYNLNEARNEVAPWFTLWQEHCQCHFDLPAAEEILAGQVPGSDGGRLFLAHSYCKIVLQQISYFIPTKNGDANDPSLYDWVNHLSDTQLSELKGELHDHIVETVNPCQLGAVECSDLLAAVYQEMFPPALRHLLGEYYTPSWLIEHSISHAEHYRSDISNSVTVLDPAAGSGSILAHYIARFASWKSSLRVEIVGFDVNPLAVEFCRTNTQIAVLKAGACSPNISYRVRIHLADAVVDPVIEVGGSLFESIGYIEKKILGVVFPKGEISRSLLDAAIKPFQINEEMSSFFSPVLRSYVLDAFVAVDRTEANVVVGNPPWITWDGLTKNYRDKVAPQWASSTLVTNTGWKAKVAAGKIDFSSLFVYRAAQRHAAVGAIMVFVLPLSLFQSRLAGAGFRKFLTAEGRSFALIELDNFSNVKVFPDAVNRTSVGVFAVDRDLSYPIPFTTWNAREGDAGYLEPRAALGGPLDPAEGNSPLVVFDQGRDGLELAVGKSDYRARGGVNTGGANTILWLEVLERTALTSLVRNVGKSRRASSPVKTAEVEREVVYPLLCGTDMQRWKATPRKSILLLYSDDMPKKATPVVIVKQKFPKAFEFLSWFQAELEGRKEHQRWGCSGPFYEVYRIGPYTFSPIKVVWQHTGYRKALNVSVIDDRGRQLTIPDQKVILIPFDDIEEAHYACAFLSSSVTAGLLDRYLGTDASTHILDYIALKRFAPNDKFHQRLAELSLDAHAAAKAGMPLVHLEKEIDFIVAQIFSTRK